MSPNSDSHDSDRPSAVGGNLKIIDLEFETLRQFREVMAPRLAYEGFFVATNDPLPKGTPARFRFLLPDGFVLVEGTAVVAWARYEAREADDRPGMALLFNELEHQSREIVDELIDFHIATGGDPIRNWTAGQRSRRHRNRRPERRSARREGATVRTRAVSRLRRN